MLLFWNPETTTGVENRRSYIHPFFLTSSQPRQGPLRSNVTASIFKPTSSTTKRSVSSSQAPTTKRRVSSSQAPTKTTKTRVTSALTTTTRQRVALAQASKTNVTKLGDTSTTLISIKYIKDSPGDQDSNFVVSPYQLTSQYKRMLADFPDTNITSEVLGRTASYIDLVVIKISKLEASSNKYLRAQERHKYAEEVPEKKIVFIVHALSSMGLSDLFSLTLEKYLRKLLSYYLGHLDKFDIYLMPMANPDGFIQGRKMPWNKNVSPQGACMGVALDRNFDVAWNISRKVSSCSQHYPGKTPFSEPETLAVREIFHLYSHKIIAYFHVHAGTYNMHTFKGDAVLYPRGYTEQQSDDDKYIDLRAEIDEAIANADFKVISVTVDTLQSWYGLVAGSSVDYASTVYGIPYAMELVMQIYQDPASLRSYGGSKPKEEMEYYALTEIWKRVIDVIFNSIHKKSNVVDSRLRRNWK